LWLIKQPLAAALNNNEELHSTVGGRNKKFIKLNSYGLLRMFYSRASVVVDVLGFDDFFISNSDGR
jgi:hypothetical protein